MDVLTKALEIAASQWEGRDLGVDLQPKQQLADDLADEAFELLYGGAAGGGKSYWLRYRAVKQAEENPGSHIGIVRRTLPRLKQSHEAPLNELTHGRAKHNRTESTWTFPNGSVIRFIQLQHRGDEQNYKSVEFDLLLFDEVTELLEEQYTYMLSRLRSARGHRVGSIAASNPEGVGFRWVKRRFVSPHAGDLSPGQDKPTPMQVWSPPMPNGKPGPSRVFVPATVYDNPALLEANPDYVRQLEALPDERVRRALLEGDWDAMDQIPGALWSYDTIEKHRVRSCPVLPRVVVAVDPAVSNTPTSDETGIIAAGVASAGHGYVLDDRSGRYDPDVWARRAIELWVEVEGDAIVYETNQGGDMVRDNLLNVARQMLAAGEIDYLPPLEPVRATRGKALRAQPLASLYAAGTVHHVGVLAELEQQMTTWTPEDRDSPDRLDALVWALTFLTTRRRPRRPR